MAKREIPADNIQAALSLTARCGGSEDVATLIADFQNLIRGFGFDVTAAGSWAGVGKERHYRFFFNNWPDDWQEYYRLQGFFERDFIVEASRQAIFLWNEMDPAVFESPAAIEFVQAARSRHGWIDGLVVPIRGPGGFEGIVSLAATHRVELDVASRSVLDVLCRTLHERCRVEIGLGSEPPADPPLTPREIECMKWVATGKSDWQIGALVGITGATVHFHVEQTKKKLGVRSRVQAVAILILHGLI